MAAHPVVVQSIQPSISAMDGSDFNLSNGRESDQ